MLEQLASWLQALEGEHFEFKEARNSYEFDQLARYLCALANEGGGRMVLGITDRRPRRVVGTRAFSQIERTRAGLHEELPLRIGVREIVHPDGRVLVF